MASIVAIILIVVLVLVLVPKSNCCQSLASSGALNDVVGGQFSFNNTSVLLQTPGLSTTQGLVVKVNGSTLSGESTKIFARFPARLHYQILVPAHMQPIENTTLQVPAETVHGFIGAFAGDIWKLVKSRGSYTFVRQGGP